LNGVSFRKQDANIQYLLSTIQSEHVDQQVGFH